MKRLIKIVLEGFKVSQTKNYILMRTEASGVLEAGDYEYMKRVSGLPRHLHYGIEMLKGGHSKSKYEAVAALFARLSYYAKHSDNEAKAQLWNGVAQIALGVGGFQGYEADITVTKLVRMHEDRSTLIPPNWEG